MVNQDKVWNVNDKYTSNMSTVESLDQYAGVLRACGVTDEVKAKAKEIYKLVQDIRELEYNWLVQELGNCKFVDQQAKQESSTKNKKEYKPPVYHKGVLEE